MLDPQGEEVGAAEFMPAAFRNRLLRAIDRWVIGASLLFCAKTPLDCVFIKLSSESLVDKTLGAMMTSNQFQEIYAKWFTSPIPPKNVNLNFPMTAPLKDAVAHPNDKGV